MNRDSCQKASHPSSSVTTPIDASMLLPTLLAQLYIYVRFPTTSRQVFIVKVRPGTVMFPVRFLVMFPVMLPEICPVMFLVMFRVMFLVMFLVVFLVMFLVMFLVLVIFSAVIP
mgnify:CR=1 FL=1